MRLAIADPPYPPAALGSGGIKPRASRWYGPGKAATDNPADYHPEAAEWDNPARHRQLLEHLAATYDGWAIATASDGLEAYAPLPVGAHIMAWVKPNSMPGPHRLKSCWEPVILYAPAGRRSSRSGIGQLPDVLTAGIPQKRRPFAGSKPPAWTRWVLDAMGYDPETDTVDDLFAGSGAVTAETARPILF